MSPRTSETEPPTIDEALALIGATKSLVPKKYVSKYAGKFVPVPEESEGGSSGPTKYESGWTRELSEAEYVQRVEAARKSADARRKTEAAVNAEKVANLGPLAKAQYASRLEQAAREKLAELQRRFDSATDPKVKAAIQGQMDSIEASLKLADQWLDQQRDAEEARLDARIEDAKRRADAEGTKWDQRMSQVSNSMRRQLERKAEGIRKEAEQLDKRADAMFDKAAKLSERAEQATSIVEQIRLRNEAAQLRSDAGEAVMARDQKMKDRAREYDAFGKQLEKSFNQLQRDRIRSENEMSRMVLAAENQRRRRMEQYSKAGDILSRSRDRERSTTSYFF